MVDETRSGSGPGRHGTAFGLLPPGAVVNQYRILQVLGQGGMGAVYEAEDASFGRRVALKVMLPELCQDEPALRRFVREARASAAVNDAHVATVYGTGVEAG